MINITHDTHGTKLTRSSGQPWIPASQRCCHYSTVHQCNGDSLWHGPCMNLDRHSSHILLINVQDLGGFLANYGAIIDGNGLGWNILGVPHTGIGGSHGNYETDSSPLKSDLSQYGCNTCTINSQFQTVSTALECIPLSRVSLMHYSFTTCNRTRPPQTTISRSCANSGTCVSRSPSRKTQTSTVCDSNMIYLSLHSDVCRWSIQWYRCLTSRLHFHLPLHVEQIGRVPRGHLEQGCIEVVHVIQWPREQRK